METRFISFGNSEVINVCQVTSVKRFEPKGEDAERFNLTPVTEIKLTDGDAIRLQGDAGDLAWAFFYGVSEKIKPAKK
jgi:hypothetical protein